ncbi:hypothetical protein BX600DRAFT_469088 [Xylariales sp. PMI_506]|nr:hypothetical protein BX600DRAFT_469088 [Xylariales sp. PMI_506]
MSTVDQSRSETTLASLPAEICVAVASLLANRDIKNLRLTCRALRDNYALRMDRVFLSANPLNIQVFRSIADHEILRHGIVEIIWDDARLVGDVSQGEEDEMDQFEGYPSDESGSGSENSVPRWFSLCRRRNLDDERSRKGLEERPAWRARMQQLEAQLPLDTSWAIYQDLLRQQQRVLYDGSDIAALRYGLERFPALRRINVTPAAHGYLFAPLFETPMIRAFPYGFNYPIPRGWPMPSNEDMPCELHSWDDEAERQKWRGVSIVLRELARHQERHQDHHIVEFLFNVYNIPTGVSSRILEQPCEEYNNLAAVVRRPGFKVLDLSLMGDGDEDGAWGALGNGRLYDMLAKAIELESIHFRTEIDFDQFQMPDVDFPRIRSLLPVHRWPKLQHFKLTKLLVEHNELISILASLPTSIRSIELSHLRFMDEGGNQGYEELARRLREDLDWRARPSSQRPKIIMHVDVNGGRHFRYQCMDTEINEYVYGEGHNPFQDMYSSPRAGAVRSAFEPELEVFTLFS